MWIYGEITTKSTKHTKKTFLKVNSPRASRTSPHKLFPFKMQFFVLFVSFVVASLSSTNAENLVGLHAQPPARMRHAILDCQARILFGARAVHGLEEEMIEVE